MEEEKSAGMVVPTGDRPSYESYLKVHNLLELQRCLSEPKEHDETLFIIIHQNDTKMT